MVYILLMLYCDDYKDVINRKGRIWILKLRLDLGYWNGMIVYEIGKLLLVIFEIR